MIVPKCRSSRRRAGAHPRALLLSEDGSLRKEEREALEIEKLHAFSLVRTKVKSTAMEGRILPRAQED